VGRRVESERPCQYNGFTVLKAAEGLESCFHPQGFVWCRRQLSSNDPEITVLTPIERIHTSGRQPGKLSICSIGSPAQKAGLVHLPEKVASPAPVSTRQRRQHSTRLALVRLAALLSACSFPDSVLTRPTPKNKGVGLNLSLVPSTSTTGCHCASWGSAEKKDTLHFLRFKVSFFA
jgi:hypothetical protein